MASKFCVGGRTPSSCSEQVSQLECLDKESAFIRAGKVQAKQHNSSVSYARNSLVSIYKNTFVSWWLIGSNRLSCGGLLLHPLRPSIVVFVLTHVDRISSCSSKERMRFVKALAVRFAQGMMLATSAGSSPLPLPPVRLLFDFFRCFHFAFAGLYSIAFAPSAAGANMSLDGVFVLDDGLRLSVDQRRAELVGRRSRTGRRCGNGSRVLPLRRCLLRDVSQPAEMRFAAPHHRLVHIRSADTPRTAVHRLRMGQHFNTTRAPLVVVKLRCATVATSRQWSEHRNRTSWIFFDFQENGRPRWHFEAGFGGGIASLGPDESLLDRPDEIPLVVSLTWFFTPNFLS